jgi:hypothetical protein
MVTGEISEVRGEEGEDGVVHGMGMEVEHPDPAGSLQ